MHRLKPDKIRYIVVHHSESGGGGKSFLRHVHVDENGWADVGYHYIIGNGVAWGGYAALADGAVADGRAIKYQGAHCRGHNAESIGICVIGKLGEMDPTLNQERSLIGLLSELCMRYNLTDSAIVGHRDLNETDCPGDRMYAKLPKVRRHVRATLAAMRMLARGGKA